METNSYYNIIRSDVNYRMAINFYGQHYYNSPATINFNGKKFIIGAGGSDEIIIRAPYILTLNSSLEYASLEKITETGIDDIVFCQNSQDFEGCKDFFNKSIKTQVLFLSQWDNN